MEKVKYGFYLKLIALFLFVVTIGVIKFQPSEAISDSKKVLRIGLGTTDIKCLDPHYIFGFQDMIHHDMIFDGLLRFKPGDVTVIEPDIAESYKISEDGMELVFYLRKGVMTHPFKDHPEGVEFTSEDVVFSLQKAGNPKFSADSKLFKNFVVEAIDKYTVKVTLKDRIPSPERAFVDYRGGHMVPKKAFKIIGPDAFKTQPVGTGPFRITEYVPGQKVLLAPHEKYWRGRPRLDGIEVWLMPEDNSREFGFRSGELNMIDGRKEQVWVEKMRKMPNSQVDIFGPGETAFLSFNITKKPFDSLLVRKAMAYALDRKQSIALMGNDVSEAMCGQVPPFFPGGLTCDEVAKAGLLYKVDLEKAKELLRKAGYPEGFSITQVISERSTYRSPTENFQAQWKKIGINMKLKLVDHATYHAQIRKDINPYVLYICQRPNADVWLTNFFHSDSIVVTGKSPITNFSHCTIIDDLIVKAKNETDKEKQIQFWKEAQYKLLENAVSYPIYIMKQVWARKSNVDLGHKLKSSFALYPQINELTEILQ